MPDNEFYPSADGQFRMTEDQWERLHKARERLIGKGKILNPDWIRPHVERLPMRAAYALTVEIDEREIRQLQTGDLTIAEELARILTVAILKNLSR